MPDASHSLMSLPHSVHRSSSGLALVVVVAAAPPDPPEPLEPVEHPFPETRAPSTKSGKLHPEVTEICEVSDDRREWWPLCREFIDLASVSISLRRKNKEECTIIQ